MVEKFKVIFGKIKFCKLLFFEIGRRFNFVENSSINK